MAQPTSGVGPSLIYACYCVMLPLCWGRKQKYHMKKQFLQYFCIRQTQEIMEITVTQGLSSFLSLFCISVIYCAFHKNIWSHKEVKPAYIIMIVLK